MSRAMYLAAAVLALPTSAHAWEIDAPAINETELAELRGGFLLPTGIEANFGAVARTYADGVLVLETHFTWRDGGVLQQAAAAPNLTPSGDLPGGFQLLDGDGATSFAHVIDDAGLRNILLNDANGRDIRVDTQLTVTLPGFDASQAAFAESLLALHLFDDLAATYP